MSLTEKVDCVEEGLSRLISRYSEKPRITALLTSYLTQVQDLEDAIWQVYTLRWLNTATGVQLDNLGTVVGEKRKGKTDDIYRRFLAARVRVNRSSGHTDDLVAIAKLLLAGIEPVRAQEEYPAAIRIDVTDAGTLPVADIAAMLIEAKPAGVRLTFVYSTETDDESFELGFDGTETDGDAHGLGDEGDTTGGLLSGEIVG